MKSLAAARSGPVQALQRSYGRICATVQQQAAVLAYIDVFWIMGTVCLLAIGILWFAKKTKPGQAAMDH